MSMVCLQSRAAILGITAALLATTATGCGDDESSTPSSSSTAGSTAGTGGAGGAGGTGGAGGAGTAHVIIAFEGRVGDTAFDCNATYPALGKSGAEVKITDFRLYVHDMRLHTAGGGEKIPVQLEQDGLWQHQNLALLDFEDKSGSCANGTSEKNGLIMGEVPAGEYDGISFKLGVPFELNHGDASVAPSPLNLTALFWNWNGGYKFLRVDSVPTAGSGPFNLHLGSTGCLPEMGDVTSCDRPNVAEIVLTGFDPAKNKIVVDYAAIVAESDLSQDAGGAPGCMSGPMDPECGVIFERLGIVIQDGSIHPEMQTFFRVE